LDHFCKAPKSLLKQSFAIDKVYTILIFIHMKISQLRAIIREELEKHPLAAPVRRKYNKLANSSVTEEEIIDHYLQTGEHLGKIAEKFGLPLVVIRRVVHQYLQSTMRNK
jgi:hypothetical protein